jgi:hypothetical protein
VSISRAQCFDLVSFLSFDLPNLVKLHAGGLLILFLSRRIERLEWSLAPLVSSVSTQQLAPGRFSFPLSSPILGAGVEPPIWVLFSSAVDLLCSKFALVSVSRAQCFDLVSFLSFDLPDLVKLHAGGLLILFLSRRIEKLEFSSIFMCSHDGLSITPTRYSIKYA